MTTALPRAFPVLDGFGREDESRLCLAHCTRFPLAAAGGLSVPDGEFRSGGFCAFSVYLQLCGIMSKMDRRKFIQMKRSIFIAFVLLLILISGCSSSTAQPTGTVEAVPSATVGPAGAASTPVSERVVATFTPVSAPKSDASAKPTVTSSAVTAEPGTEQKKPALFFFYADWCSACSQMRPVVDKLEPEYSDRIRFIKVNVDDPQARELVVMAGVRAIPLTLFVTSPDGQGQRWIGPQPETVLRAAFDNFLQ